MKKIVISLFLGIFLITGCHPAVKKTAESCCTNDKSSMLVVLNIQQKIKPEYVEAYKEVFEACRAITRTEEGCIDYTLYQSYTDTTVFMLVEVWENEAALGKHSESEHLRAFRETTKEMPDPDFNRNVNRFYACPF